MGVGISFFFFVLDISYFAFFGIRNTSLYHYSATVLFADIFCRSAMTMLWILDVQTSGCVWARSCQITILGNRLAPERGWCCDLIDLLPTPAQSSSFFDVLRIVR